MRQTHFLVDCEARMGVVSPIVEPATHIGIVLFDRPPFETAYHWQRPADWATNLQGLNIATRNMHLWISEHTPLDARAVMVSDNPAFDWQWVAALFHQASLPNPFGHSARRIGDFWAGSRARWHDQSSWKRFRQTPHDHNPVHDARGNAEALWAILNPAEGS